MASTSIATAENNQIAISGSVPSYIKNTGRGNENVGTNVTIPRIKLLQKMSDEVDKHHSKFVKGAEPGNFMDSITLKNYGDELFVISLTFKEDFVVWKKRDFGGGLLGTYSSLSAAEEAVNQQEKPLEYDIVPTHAHLLLVKDPETGELERTPFIMDFASTKLKVSKNWNSQIQMKGGDRFASVWKLSSFSAENKAGNAYLSINAEFVGWATESDYLHAEKLYSEYKI